MLSIDYFIYRTLRICFVRMTKLPCHNHIERGLEPWTILRGQTLGDLLTARYRFEQIRIQQVKVFES